jgi:hypothetical protein
MGVYHMFMTDRSALITPRMPPCTTSVHIPDSYPIDASFISVSVFSVCCYSRVFISMLLALRLIRVHCLYSDFTTHK